MKTKIAWTYWYWTTGTENLFELSKLELEIFKDFCNLASFY